MWETKLQKLGHQKSHCNKLKGEKNDTPSTLVRMLLLEKTPPRERKEKKNVEHAVMCPNVSECSITL